MASMPVTWLMRLAALPVGAVSTTERPSSSIRAIIVLMVVVLPVPGPPVRAMQPQDADVCTAINCSTASSTPFLRAMARICSSSCSGLSGHFFPVSRIDKRRRAV